MLASRPPDGGPGRSFRGKQSRAMRQQRLLPSPPEGGGQGSCNYELSQLLHVPLSAANLQQDLAHGLYNQFGPTPFVPTGASAGLAGLPDRPLANPPRRSCTPVRPVLSGRDQASPTLPLSWPARPVIMPLAVTRAFSPRALSRGGALRQDAFDAQPQRRRGRRRAPARPPCGVNASASLASKAAAAIAVLLRQPTRRPRGLPDRPFSNGRPRTGPGAFGAIPSVMVISSVQSAGHSPSRREPGRMQY